jgi:regulator of protease activity HflC (stomatin/prohibitin superfamily)
MRRRGFRVWPFGEGIHLIWPWNRMYLYDIRLHQVSHTYDVLTNDGLDVKAEVTIRWKPIEADLGKLHRDIGPHYVETLIIPLVGSYVREEIAGYTPDALYSPLRLVIQEAVRAKTKQALMSRFYPEMRRESYILVEDILIRNVELPREVRAAIQDKVVQKHIAESFKYRLDRERQEAERKAIEAQGIQRFQAAINSTISEGYLKWKGIDATLELAKSQNAKIVVIGSGKDGLPLILGGVDGVQTSAAPRPAVAPPP